VGPDLVGTAGFRLRFHQSELSKSFQDFEESAGRFSLPVNDRPMSPVPIHQEGYIAVLFYPSRPAYHKGMVDLRKGPLLELQAQPSKGFLCFRKENDPAGFLVDPMNRPEGGIGRCGQVWLLGYRGIQTGLLIATIYG